MIFPGDVKGFLSPKEGELLAEYATGKTCLEIGTYCGLSSICIAQTATRLHVVDTFMSEQFAGGGFTLAVFVANLWKYKVRSKVCIHVGACEDVLPSLRDHSFDLAFVDGDHRFEGVKSDLIGVRRMLRRGGVLICHDYGMDGVRLALDYLGLGRPSVLVDSTAVFEGVT